MPERQITYSNNAFSTDFSIEVHRMGAEPHGDLRRATEALLAQLVEKYGADITKKALQPKQGRIYLTTTRDSQAFAELQQLANQAKEPGCQSL